MEAKWKVDSIEYLRAVLDTSFTQEETSETIVPDAYPDMAAIVDVEGNITLRSKEAGAGRLSVSGAIAVSVVYLPEGEEGLRSLELSIPFTAGHDWAEISDNTEAIVTVRLGSIDARMINSRKVLVRADVLVEAKGYEPASMTCTTALEDAAEAGLHVRREEIEQSFVSGVREKTFALSDEFPLPAGRPPIGQILKSRIRLSADDVKNVGNKLIFKGEAKIHVLYTAQNTPEPHALDLVANFSQIMELEGDGEHATYEISLMLTNVYIETGMTESGAIGVELHMVAQAIEKKSRTIPYISDAYSTKFDLDTRQIEHTLESLDPEELLYAEVRETIDLGGPVLRVINSSAYTGRVQITQEGGKLVLRTSVFCSVIYVTDTGRLAGLTRRFEAKTELDQRPNRTYTASGHPTGEAQIMLTPNGLELRLGITFTVWPCRKLRFTAIGGVSWDETAPRDLASLPSVVVFHAEGGESLWQLARRYCSTEEQIAAANGLGEDAVPYPGQLFIIPKAR
ncbi:MAG: DUF3794 domain-containing protein [Oscillospiraceae bacterium]|nr:DUF3794 domain-containing protein [Oscillospiraceae bacterium]